MILIFGLVVFQLMVMATADCSPKLDNAVVEDLFTKLVKYKGGSEFRNYRKWRDIPALTASLSASQTINANDVVKFDKIWTNNGNHYNPKTGIFKAPREGLYHVSTTVMSTHGKTVHVRIWHNGNKTVALYPGTGYSKATANMVLHLKKGDTVTVKGAGGSTALFSSSEHFSMFSAYLIA